MSGRILAAAAALAAGLTAPCAWAQATPRDEPGPVALDNDYVRVARNAAPCAQTAAGSCEDRVIVAMDKIEIRVGNTRRKLTRGQVAVFDRSQSYAPPQGGAYFEVAIKPNHPPVKSPPEMIPPEKNQPIYDGERFFVYIEQLAPGDIRARHSHSQRVEIRLNVGPLLDQWFDPPAPPVIPSIVNFRQATIHTTRNIGDMPLRNLIIEFKPERR